MNSIFQGLREEPVEPSDATTVACPKCSAVFPNAPRCANCGASLRPLLLSILTILWCTWSVCSVLLAAAMATKLHLWHFGPGNTLVFDAEEDVPFFLVIFFALAIVPIPLGVRLGRYWAWITIQGAFLVSIGLMLLWGVDHFGGRPIGVAVRVGIYLLTMALLWWYIRSDRVEAYCSVGRSVPLRTVGLWAAGGALAGAVAGYCMAWLVDGETVFRFAVRGGVQGLVQPDYIEGNLRLFAAVLAASIGAAALCEAAIATAKRV